MPIIGNLPVVFNAVRNILLKSCIYLLKKVCNAVVTNGLVVKHWTQDLKVAGSIPTHVGVFFMENYLDLSNNIYR